MRFRLPVPNDPYQGVYNATNFGPACLQQAQSYSVPENLDPEAKTVLGILGGGGFANTSEDCEHTSPPNTILLVAHSMIPQV